MPPTSAVAPSEPVAALKSARLRPWQVVAYRISLPVFALLFLWGVFGVYCLTDSDKKSWLSQTPAAETLRWLIAKNTAFLAFPFNGGMFGFILALTALRQHARASQPAHKKLSRQERRHPENAKQE